MQDRVIDTLDESPESELLRAQERNISRVCKQPTLSDLLKHMDKHGTECILDSALHLREDQYAILVRRCKLHVKNAKAARKAKRRS